MTINPAKRLLDLIQRADSIAGGDGRENCGEIWRRVLDARSETAATFLQRYAAVLELPEEARADFVDRFGEDQPYLAWLPKITAAFESVAMLSEWRAFRHHLDPATMQQLTFCANRLSKAFPADQPPNASEVKKLEEHLARIVDEAASAEGVDQDLREFVVRRTGEIQAAVLLWRVGVGSPERVVRAIEAAAGACSEETREELERLTWGKRFLSILSWAMDKTGGGVIGYGVGRGIEALIAAVVVST